MERRYSDAGDHQGSSSLINNLGFSSGVCVIPSRGLIHSRTIESVEKNLRYMEESYRQSWMTLYSHRRPIPDAQNWAISAALIQNPRWIWMVEEDIVVPYGRLQELQEMMEEEKVKVVASTYRLEGGQDVHYISEKGELLFTGLGCVLFDTSLFHQLKSPWFRTEQYSIDGEDLRRLPEKAQYGGQDVNLFLRLREEGISWALHDGIVGHLRVVSQGKSGTNQGVHNIIAIQ